MRTDAGSQRKKIFVFLRGTSNKSHFYTQLIIPVRVLFSDIVRASNVMLQSQNSAFFVLHKYLCRGEEEHGEENMVHHDGV